MVAFFVAPLVVMVRKTAEGDGLWTNLRTVLTNPRLPRFVLNSLLVSVSTAGAAALRVQVWRKLRSLGALYLQQSVCLLPAREDMVREVRRLADRVRHQGGSCRLLHVGILNALGTQPNVSPNRSREQKRILQHHSEAPAQIRQAHFPEVHAIHADRSLLHIVKTHKQRDERSLAGPCVTDHGYSFSGFNGKGDVPQHPVGLCTFRRDFLWLSRSRPAMAIAAFRFFALRHLAVREPHMIELDPPRTLRFLRYRRRDYLHFRVQQLENALARCHC